MAVQAFSPQIRLCYNLVRLEQLDMTLEQTIQSVPSMTVDDRLRLADAIWDSFDETDIPPLTPRNGPSSIVEWRITMPTRRLL